MRKQYLPESWSNEMLTQEKKFMQHHVVIVWHCPSQAAFWIKRHSVANLYIKHVRTTPHQPWNWLYAFHLLKIKCIYWILTMDNIEKCWKHTHLYDHYQTTTTTTLKAIGIVLGSFRTITSAQRIKPSITKTWKQNEKHSLPLRPSSHKIFLPM